MVSNDLQEKARPGISIQSIGQLIQHTRQNHAMEHATIHILGQRYPNALLMGRSTPYGFYLYGELPTNEVARASAEALARLLAQEKDLAVHPRCGTNLVVGSLLSGTAALLAMGRRGRSLLESVPLVLLAVNLALLFAQPLGRLAQARLTTSLQVQDVHIAAVSRKKLGKQTVHYIRLARA